MKRDPTIMTETYNSIIVYKCINKIINSIFNTSKELQNPILGFSHQLYFII